MANNTVALAGGDRKVAPLKSLQVAAFFDAIEGAKDETKVQTFTRSLRTVAQALKNGGDQLVDGLSEEDAITKINETADWREIDAAFGSVLDISGLRKTTEGEAPAAESTSTESSAALSAS